MNANCGTSDVVRRTVVQLLRFLLTDEYLLYVATWHARWQVASPAFGDLPQEFETQFAQIAHDMGTLAERTRALTVSVGERWNGFTQAVCSSANRRDGLPVERLITDLVVMHDEIVRQLRVDTAACRAMSEAADTADFLAGLTERHERVAANLQAHLKTSQTVRRQLN